MKQIPYNRQRAVEYAKKWAFSRNPKYYNFDSVGGDCTSFISQCIYAGSNTMNYAKEKGWYYINGNNKSPSWSGVEFLHKFLIENQSVGPYGTHTTQTNIEKGDIAQLSFDGKIFGHSLIIVNIENNYSLYGIKIASHTLDSYNKPIAEYNYAKIRFIHIQGVRIY